MLKPSDVTIRPWPVSEDAAKQRLAIEAHIDERLRLSGLSGLWPCQVPRVRAGWTHDNIDAVLKAYTETGWLVTNGNNNVMATIDLPPVRTGL